VSVTVSKATLRQYELREAKTWAEAGWLTEVAWKQALFIGGGRLITKPRDFFGTKDQAGFDVMAVHPLGKVAWIQVTASPFVKERDQKADRNAAHGKPPFSFDAPHKDVDAWMVNNEGNYGVWYDELGTIIVSYADARHPERRWWTATPLVDK